MSDLFAYYEGTLAEFLLDAIEERGRLVKIVIQYADRELVASLAGAFPVLGADRLSVKRADALPSHDGFQQFSHDRPPSLLQLRLHSENNDVCEFNNSIAKLVS